MRTDSWLHYFCGSIFGIVAIAHLIRILLNLQVVIGGWNIPIWLSGWAVVLLGALSIWLFKTA